MRREELCDCSICQWASSNSDDTTAPFSSKRRCRRELRAEVDRSVMAPGYVVSPSCLAPRCWAGPPTSLAALLTPANGFGPDPRNWSVATVGKFIERITQVPDYAELFKKEIIDGDSLLGLSQEDLRKCLRLKLGPTLKLYNAIVYLRKKVTS